MRLGKYGVRLFTLIWISLFSTICLAQELPGTDAEFGEPAAISGQGWDFLFTLEEASYAMGWFEHQPRFTPNEDEKMLILQYRVQNMSDTEKRLSYREFDFTAFDSAGIGYDSFQGPRPSGGTDEIETILKPNQAVDVYGAVLVPADKEIVKLMVEANPGENPVLRYDLRGEVDPLPSRYSDNGYAVRDRLQAQVGEKLPVAGFDIKVGEFSITDDPIYDGAAPGSGQVWGVLPMEITSRYHDDEMRLSYRNFDPAILVEAGGGQIESYGMIADTSDRRFDVQPEAGETYRMRLLYRMDEAAEPEELRLKVRMASRNGDSHEFRIPLTDGASEAIQARDEMVRGGGAFQVPNLTDLRPGYVEGRFAEGIFDPEEKVVIRVQDPVDAGGIPEATGNPNPGNDEQTVEDLSRYARTAEVQINAVDAVVANESGGDELLFVTATYFGIQGSGDFSLNVETFRGRDGSDYLREAGGMVLLDQPSVLWIDLPAYTVYGMSVMVIEEDNSSQSELDEMEREFEAELNRRLRRAFAAQDVLAPVNASDEVQRSHATGMDWLWRNIVGDFENASSLRVLARRIQEDATGGLDNDDDFIGAFTVMWINLPTLDAATVLNGIGGDNADTLFEAGQPRYGVTAPGEYWFDLYESRDDFSIFIESPTDYDAHYRLRYRNQLTGGN